MRNLNIALYPLHHQGHLLEKAHLSLIGSGAQTYLWIGDERGCYSFSYSGTPEAQRRLRHLAESILRRLGKSKIANPKSKIV